MRAEDKVILVTGAGSGIGRELALLLLSKRARVAGVDLNPESLAQTSELAAQWACDFRPLVADITDRSAVERLPEQVCACLGPVDAVINNAGIIQPFARVSDLDYATIERVLNVNLLGTLYVIKAFLPHLLKRPEAHIVNLSSMGGFVPIPGQAIYCAAKAGVKLMSEGIAAELIGTHIRVTVVFPGAIATNIAENSGIKPAPIVSSKSGAMKPMPATKAAEIIVRAMERNARHVFVGWDSALMNGLHRLNPGFAARTIANKMRSLLPT